MEQKMGSKVNPMEFYTVNDISRILQHTNMNVRKKLKDGVIPGGFHIGNRWRIEKQEFDKRLYDISIKS